MVEGLLGRLRHHLTYMSDLAERQVDTAIMALVDGNPQMADQVLQAEEEMNALDLQVSRIAQDILAKIHPEGENFRFTIAGMRSAMFLQRISAIASDTAFHARRLQKGACIHNPESLSGLLETAERMVRDSVHALVSGDAESAWDTVREADEVEADVNRIVNACEVETKPNADNVVHMLMAVMDLKRITDHAVSIAEEVIYMVEGRLVRHVARLLLKGKPEPKVNI